MSTVICRYDNHQQQSFVFKTKWSIFRI